MQNSCDSDVLLDDVGVETEAGPVEADVEVAVAVEIVRSEEDVQITDGVDNHEHDEEEGGAGEADAVVVEDEIAGEEDGAEDLHEEGPDHGDD